MSKQRTWRDISRPIIADVIGRVGRDDPKKLKKALFEAYPFRERRFWPYKVWLDEIKIQLHGKKSKSKMSLAERKTGFLFNERE